jgi:hypothetical protein
MRHVGVRRFVTLSKETVFAMLGVAMIATFAVDMTTTPRADAAALPTIQFSPAGTTLVKTPVTTVPVTTVPPTPTTTVAPAIVPALTTTAPPRTIPSHVVVKKAPAPVKAKPKPAPAAATHPAKSPAALGLFVGSQSPADVMALGSQLGVTPTIDTVYADQSSDYCTYTPPTTSLTLMVGIGNCTAAQVAAIGQNLVNAGQSHAIIRVMWEQNQADAGWFQGWNQLTLSAAQYIAIFQSTVTAMRAESPSFRFMWNPNGGTANEAAGRVWTDTWPGKAYVNLVGVDQYDWAGYAGDVQAVVAFAHTQGLPVAIPEWGLNGSDDPTFINTMVGLINNPANDITVEAYFSYAGSTDSDITQFPASEAAYKADLG